MFFVGKCNIPGMRPSLLQTESRNAPDPMRLFKTTRPCDTSDNLLRSLAEGSPKACMEAYRLLSDRIYPTALRICGNTQDAEDAMQEAFLRLFKVCADGQCEFTSCIETLVAWLRRTAANCAIDILRRRMLFSTSEPTDTDLKSEEPDDPEADIEAVRQALKLLPASSRTILSLHLFEGYDYEECAEILGIPQSTVRVQYLRAKRRLIKELTHNGQAH